MPSLIFIDTNIFLDFYRMEGGEAAARQLKFIDNNRSRIITGNQVQMEFMKHRQQVIIDTITKIKRTDGGLNQLPPVLVDAQPASQIKKNVKQLETQQKRIRERIERMLINPVYNDKVYQCAQRLFKNNSDINLSREKAIRLEIRELAQKRFMLGYPPRKGGDTSIGDAINWEWIIHCAIEAEADVLVVSRDGDYGPTYQKSAYINDWLAQEFKQRVRPIRKIKLTNRLTDAMNRENVNVTDEDKEQETKLLENWPAVVQRDLSFSPVNEEVLKAMWSRLTNLRSDLD